MSKIDEWVTIKELAQELGVSVATIYAWRTKGTGPRGATFGKHVRFRRSEIERWAEQQSDPAPA